MDNNLCIHLAYLLYFAQARFQSWDLSHPAAMQGQGDKKNKLHCVTAIGREIGRKKSLYYHRLGQPLSKPQMKNSSNISSQNIPEAVSSQFITVTCGTHTHTAPGVLFILEATQYPVFLTLGAAPVHSGSRRFVRVQMRAGSVSARPATLLNTSPPPLNFPP